MQIFLCEKVKFPFALLDRQKKEKNTADTLALSSALNSQLSASSQRNISTPSELFWPKLGESQLFCMLSWNPSPRFQKIFIKCDGSIIVNVAAIFQHF